MLKLSRINKSYGEGNARQKVIKDLSIIFPSSGFFSILGKSGSGKTTLLNIIGGIDSFDSGEMSLFGLNSSTLSKTDWSKIHTHIISFVFQEYNLLDQFTVIENLRFAVPNVEDKIFEETLDKFELLDKKDKYPNQLSGGEKQRIAILRALLKESKVILVDEPTGNLDDDTSLLVINFLKELTKDKLVIMVTHDKEIADKYSDEVLQMRHGTLNRVSKDDVVSNTLISLDGFSALRLSTFNAMKLSLKQMKMKLGKYIQYVLMFSITLFFLSLGFTLLFVNEFSVASQNLIDTNTLYYKYTPIYIDNSDEKNFFDGLESNVYKYYEPYSYILEENGESSGDNSYISVLNGYIQYNDEIEIILGVSPVQENEIVISDYLAKALETDFENVTSMDDIIGYIIPDTSMVVSGIYKTDYEEYLSIYDMDGNFQYNNDIDSTLKSIAQYKVTDVYSIIYVSSDFNYANTKHQLKGYLPDFSSATTNGSIRITPFTDNDKVVYSAFNDVIISPNDVFVSKEVLSIIIQRDLNYNITSDGEFKAYWDENEQELVEYILGKEISLSHTLRIKDTIYPFDSVVIQGVYSNDDEVTKTIQVSDSLYNEMFVSDYVYAITNDNANDLEEDMKILHSKNYEFDGFNLSSIMSFKEDTKPVIINIANGVSLVFSLFTILLFTNLLSRDITYMHSEIGLLRTLGIRMRSISKLFILEIVVLGFASLLVAIILHPIGLDLLNYIWTADYKDLVIISFDIRTILLMFVAVCIIMLITIIIPFSKLSRLKLIDCIKSNN